jgi:mono/diheme cytochrome c family protein
MATKTQCSIVLAVAASLAPAAIFAQSAGKAIYEHRCLACHGADGMAGAGIGKIMKVRPATDPAVKKYTRQEMIDFTRNGIGKMQAYKNDLTDEQIKDSVDYFRLFIK